MGLFAALLGLVSFVVLLHGFGLAVKNLGSATAQLEIFSRGEFLAVLFAAILGALSITNEMRHGTIRTTFLVTPRRDRVVAAKVVTTTMLGATFGLAASGLAAGVGTVALLVRGIDVRLDAGDFVLLIAGGSAAAALWAAIGVGLGAILRHQVPTLVGISAWLLFVEGLLVGDVPAVRSVGRFTPGAVASAMTGLHRGTLVAPAIGLVVLVVYAVTVVLAGSFATARRDVA